MKTRGYPGNARVASLAERVGGGRGQTWGKKWKFAWGNIQGGEMEYDELTAANRIGGGRMMKRRHNRRGRNMII